MSNQLIQPSKAIIPMKETNELATGLGAIGAQTVELIKEKADQVTFITIISKYTDELLLLPQAVNGLRGNFKSEAQGATPAQADTVADLVVQPMVQKGLHPMLANSIKHGIAGGYSTYCYIVQSGQEAIE